MTRDHINKLTCWDKSTPSATNECEVTENEQMECDAGEAYLVELFDLRA